MHPHVNLYFNPTVLYLLGKDKLFFEILRCFVSDIITRVIEARVAVNKRRIGTVTLNQGGLMIYCDICLYKDEKLWIRMPEYWVNEETKIRFAFWETKELSDQKQDFILKKVFDMIGLDVPRAVEEKKAYRDMQTKKKELTKQENKLTLNEKSSEE